jgi:NAD-dependent DNA ligase
MVVTGQFMNISRNEIEDLIVAKGGKKTSAVSGKTNYLVAGYKLEDGRDVNTSGKY